MFGRGVNYWISWADLTFMLFIGGLAAVAFSDEQRTAAQRELAAAKTELAEARGALDVLRSHSNPCADASPFLAGFSSCVAQATGRRQVPGSGCFVTVGEDVIRFEKGKAVPLDPSSADAVAGCLYTNALHFAAADPRSFNAITIHVDGHTDCVGTRAGNEKLGADRAFSVYARLLERAERDPVWLSPKQRRAFLGRIAVRSFGDTRPVEGSRCIAPFGWEGDRRVVVSVQLATEGAAGRRG